MLKYCPFVAAGAGRGIIEDTSPHELWEIIDHIDKTTEPVEVMDLVLGRPVKWDYRVCAPIEYAILFKEEAR